MSQTTVDRDVSLLQRAPILAACRDGPVGRSTIADRADCSRATAYRATTDLEAAGLVAGANGGYRLTGSGRAALERVERLRAELDGARHLQPMLERVDAPELRDNTHLFADATVAVATAEHPHAPIERWLEQFASFERFRGTVVAGCPPAVTDRGLGHVEADLDMEVICTPLALEADRNASREAFETIAAAEGTSLYTHPDLPFTMSIIDDVVAVVGFDDETAQPVTSLTTDDPDAFAWAEDLYERYRREATPFVVE